MRITVFLLFGTFSVVASQCPSEYIYNGDFGKCYLFVNNPVSFEEAEDYCITRGGHLSSILNAFENNFIITLASAYLNSRSLYWIGGTSNYTQWIWTNRMPFLYSNFNHPRTGNCIYILGKYWGSQDCSKEYPFVCEVFSGSGWATTTVKPAPPPCPSSWKYFAPTDSCYKLFDSNYTDYTSWSAADKYCKEQGGQLTSIHSDAENWFIAGLVGQLDPWIGLTKYSTSTNPQDGWYWTDQSALNYTRWYPNEPDGVSHCGYLNNLHGDAYWDNSECSYRSSFVCKATSEH